MRLDPGQPAQAAGAGTNPQVARLFESINGESRERIAAEFLSDAAAPPPVLSTKMLMSMPAQKPRPAPVMQMAVTSGSRSAASAKRLTAAIIGSVSALSASGRSSRISAMRPCFS